MTALSVHSREKLAHGLNSREAANELERLLQYPQVAGSTFYVDANHASTSDSNSGLSPNEPFETIAAAMTACTAGKGDCIILMPGHAETYTTTGSKLTVKAGVSIVGVGSGAYRPTFTFSHTGATWTMSGAGATLSNLLFVAGVDSVVTYATISAADVTLLDIETRDTTDVEVISDFTTTAAAERLTVKRFFKNGYTDGNANARVFHLVGVDRALFEDCRFITKVTTAVIGFVTTACTAINIRNCVFLVDSTTNFSKTVVDTVSGSTWSVDGCFDLGAGSNFSGGSGAALGGDDVGAVNTAVTSVGTQVGSVGTQAGSVGTQVGSVGTLTTSVGTQAASLGTQINTADLVSTIVSAQTAIITACSN